MQQRKTLAPDPGIVMEGDTAPCQTLACVMVWELTCGYETVFVEQEVGFVVL